MDRQNSDLTAMPIAGRIPFSSVLIMNTSYLRNFCMIFICDTIKIHRIRSETKYVVLTISQCYKFCSAQFPVPTQLAVLFNHLYRAGGFHLTFVFFGGGAKPWMRPGPGGRAIESDSDGTPVIASGGSPASSASQPGPGIKSRCSHMRRSLRRLLPQIPASRADRGQAISRSCGWLSTRRDRNSSKGGDARSRPPARGGRSAIRHLQVHLACHRPIVSPAEAGAPATAEPPADALDYFIPQAAIGMIEECRYFSSTSPVINDRRTSCSGRSPVRLRPK